MKAEELAKILAETDCAQMVEARGNLPTIVTHVNEGRVVVLTKSGKPVAEIFPPGTDKTLDDVVAMLQVIREHGLGSPESGMAVDAVAARCIPGVEGSWVRGG